ncbi:MAG: poly(A) polymerase [Proteobacteria bacterium]|nr:poly(A) polymerase [Pseudomonadota bacterium]MBU1737542.1 poly(A) polymerase [Pseudomonadota bacterium]
MTELPPPKIFTRDQHPISRNNIDREALKVLYRLRDAGYSAYLVGGGVRDLFLGKTPKDFDISTNARPGELRKLFKSSRVIGRRFRLVQVFFRGNNVIEVSTLRCRSEHDIDGPDQVLQANNTYGSVAEDAFRRDLTINSLFYEIENFTVIDYVGGVADLQSRIIRIVGDPARRIRRDPVRMMRALRHAARSGFTIEEKTWQAILEHADHLKQCPDSRIRDELLKDLRGGASRAWSELAMDSGLLPILIPLYRPEVIAKTRERIFSCLSVADRLQAGGAILPEHLLLSLFLLPWAEKELNVLAAPIKGQEGFKFARTLRTRLDEALKDLNIKRVQKESITGLLSNLPVFIKHAKDHELPKWLTRKSFFKDGLQFYRLFVETTGGPPAEVEIENPLDEQPRKKRMSRSRNTGSRAPAFTNTRGGIFGLKRNDRPKRNQ